MFCSNCGNKLQEGANFCNKCGASVSSNINTPQQTSSGTDNTLNKLLIRANHFYTSGDYENALNYYNSILDTDFSNKQAKTGIINVLTAMADLETRKGDFARALSYLVKAAGTGYAVDENSIILKIKNTCELYYQDCRTEEDFLNMDKEINFLSLNNNFKIRNIYDTYRSRIALSHFSDKLLVFDLPEAGIFTSDRVKLYTDRLTIESKSGTTLKHKYKIKDIIDLKVKGRTLCFKERGFISNSSVEIDIDNANMNNIVEAIKELQNGRVPSLGTKYYEQ